MVTPDANGHVNATALSAELGESTVLGYAGVEGSTAAQNAGFYSCQALKTIEIPSSVETIGSFAFYNSGLTHLTIPSSVKTIRNDAYWKCDDLESVDFSLATQLATIGDYAFYDARALTSVDFSDATALTTIGVRAFKDTCLLSVPEHSATTVGTEAFSNICFHKCRLGADPPGMNITTGHGTYSDASQSFKGCTLLTSVKIEDDVTTIGDRAFYSATALTSVTFPNSVISIGDRAFYSATALTSVTIPSSVTTIGPFAFYDTCLLSVPDHSATTVGTSAFNNICFHKCRLGADPPGMNITTGHGTYSDASQSFQYCKMLTSVKIEDDVEEIGSYAFKDTALTSVTVPVCTHIGTETFPSATNLVRSFPRACVDNYVSKGTSVSTVLDSFTPQELKAAYRAKNVCPS